MSLCQSKDGSSCGGCCGLFNLDYPRSYLLEILNDRTQNFSEKVDYSKRETVISCREEFEQKENSYLKKDATIYNCPFLGYIEPDQKRIGCMIHPIRTGDPKSQNFSFYGASICQTYDCKNKERKNVSDWEKFLASLNLDSYEYSNLAGDHILITRIEEFFIACGISLEIIFRDYSVLLKEILLYKFMKGTSHITSFEIDMESSMHGSKFQKLVDKLGLAATEELYLELENLKDCYR